MSQDRQRRKRERSRRRLTPPRKLAPAGPAPAHGLLTAAADQARHAATPILQSAAATATEELARTTLGVALRLIQQSPLAGRHACRAGCAYCCHTAVTIAPPETFAIAAYLRAHCDEHDLQRVREDLERNAALAASMSREDYVAELIPCALLTADGNCRAHAVRPLACAGFLSTSRAACQAEFERVPGRAAVPVDAYAQCVGLGVSHGLKDACRQAGRDGEFYELHHALRRVLDAPDAAKRWSQGEDVFAGCLR